MFTIIAYILSYQVTIIKAFSHVYCNFFGKRKAGSVYSLPAQRLIFTNIGEKLYSEAVADSPIRFDILRLLRIVLDFVSDF